MPVALYLLVKVLGEYFNDVLVDIRPRPIVLLPDAPATGLYIPDLLHSRHGVTDPKTAFARPEAEARASSFGLNLSRQLWTYPTQAAHALILAAVEKGTQHQLVIGINDAYFLDARNIGDVNVLVDIAVRNGFDRREARDVALDLAARKQVEEEVARSAVAGIRSVPHFELGSGVTISVGHRRSRDSVGKLRKPDARFRRVPSHPTAKRTLEQDGLWPQCCLSRLDF